MHITNEWIRLQNSKLENPTSLKADSSNLYFFYGQHTSHLIFYLKCTALALLCISSLLLVCAHTGSVFLLAAIFLLRSWLPENITGFWPRIISHDGTVHADNPWLLHQQIVAKLKYIEAQQQQHMKLQQQTEESIKQMEAPITAFQHACSQSSFPISSNLTWWLSHAGQWVRG